MGQKNVPTITLVDNREAGSLRTLKATSLKR